MYTRKLFRVYTNIDLCIHMFVYTQICVYTQVCVYTRMCICVYTQPYMCIHMFVIYTNSCIHKFLSIHIYDLCIHTSTSCVHDFPPPVCMCQLTASRSQRVWAPQVVITRLLAEEDQGWLSKLDGEVVIGKDRNVNKAILNSAAALAGMALQQPTTVNQT